MEYVLPISRAIPFRLGVTLPPPWSSTVSRAPWRKSTVLVGDTLPARSSEKARMVFVPFAGVTSADQAVVPLALVQTPPFIWTQTLDNPRLSVAVPRIDTTLALETSPATGLVMAI